MIKLINILLILFLSNSLFAQELNCRVQVVSQQIQTTNRKVFENMQTSINEFINNRKWTNTVFSPEERIECNILINLTSQISVDEFQGTMQIQATRPVYNSNYNSTMFNYKDADINFKFVEFQTLEFNEGAFRSNLTSILAYWAYIIIGLDFDSFTLEGGTECFQKAEKIVNTASNSSEKGWKAFDSNIHKNRYWLIEDILDDKYRSIREFNYKYHRLGMDMMASSPSDGRGEIAEDLKLLQKVYRDKASPFMIFYLTVFDAKSDEFVNVFSESFPEEKVRVSNMLIEIDPSNSAKYQKISSSNNQ